MAHEVEFTDGNFKSEVLESETPVLVDFWAPWCGPCRMVAPVVEEIANEYEGKLKVGKMNTDENMQTAMQYQIMSIPSLLLYKGGNVVERVIGAVPKGHITKLVDKHVEMKSEA